MMIYTIGEPHPLQISVKSAKIVVVTVDGEILDNSLKSAADEKVVFAKLVKRDVAAVECSLGKTKYEAFLRKRQLLKPVETVSEQLYVGKTLACIAKFCFGH